MFFQTNTQTLTTEAVLDGSVFPKTFGLEESVFNVSIKPARLSNSFEFAVQLTKSTGDVRKNAKLRDAAEAFLATLCNFAKGHKSIISQRQYATMLGRMKAIDGNPLAAIVFESQLATA